MRATSILYISPLFRNILHEMRCFVRFSNTMTMQKFLHHIGLELATPLSQFIFNKPSRWRDEENGEFKQFSVKLERQKLVWNLLTNVFVFKLCLVKKIASAFKRKSK